MRCARCSKLNEAGASSCAYCGRPLAGRPSQARASVGGWDERVMAQLSGYAGDAKDSVLCLSCEYKGPAGFVATRFTRTGMIVTAIFSVILIPLFWMISRYQPGLVAALVCSAAFALTYFLARKFQTRIVFKCPSCESLIEAFPLADKR